MSTQIPISFRPPLTKESAMTVMRIGEAAWNSHQPERILKLFCRDAVWQNRNQTLLGREEIARYLETKKALGLHYKTHFSLWTQSNSRMSLHFVSEWQHAEKGSWFRSRGLALVELGNDGFIQDLKSNADDSVITARDRSITTQDEKSSTEKH